MTHVKTAEAFARLIDFCTGYGGTYNPGRPTLQVATMVNKLAEAREAFHQLIVARAQYDNTINARKQAFDKLPRLMASIMRLLESCGASEETLADARQFVKQISGKSPRKQESSGATSAETPASSARSSLQLAYVSKADAFARLVQTVSAEPLYQPTEAHLMVDSLRETWAVLQEHNQRVSIAKVAWSNAIIVRNEVLYSSNVSIVVTGRAVQRYVRGIFGFNSPQYAQVKSLRFNKIS